MVKCFTESLLSFFNKLGFFMKESPYLSVSMYAMVITTVEIAGVFCSPC